MDIPKTNPKPLRLLYFWIGILATFSYRSIVLLNDVSAFWVDVAWYVGTIGFIIYFSHRFQISERRSRLIHERKLVQKIVSTPGLEEEDRIAMEYVFRTLESSKEKWNYIFIFVMSGLALLVGIILELTS